MATGEHADDARNLAAEAVNGDYSGNTESQYRMRLAAIAQVHAILAVADAITELVSRINPRP